MQVTKQSEDQPGPLVPLQSSPQTVAHDGLQPYGLSSKQYTLGDQPHSVLKPHT